MAFENQSDLIVDVAVLTTQINGFSIEDKVKKVIDDKQDLYDELTKILTNKAKIEESINATIRKDMEVSLEEDLTLEELFELVNSVPYGWTYIDIQKVIDLLYANLIKIDANQTILEMKSYTNMAYFKEIDEVLRRENIKTLPEQLEQDFRNGLDKAIETFTNSDDITEDEISNIKNALAYGEDDIEIIANQLASFKIVKEILNTVIGKENLQTDNPFETFTEKDLSKFRENLDTLNLRKYKLFDHQQKVIDFMGYEIEKGAPPTQTESKFINKSIFAATTQNKAFQNDDIIDFQYIDLYIPVKYSKNRYLVTKAQMEVPSISDNYENFIRQVAVAGSFMVIAHIAFVFVAYRILIRPMRKINDVLGDQNKALEKRNKEIEEELQIAQKLQEAIIPKEAPKHDCLQLEHVWISLEAVSGDYLDIIEIDEDHVGLLVCDVSGHGLPSALVTTMAKVSFNSHSIPGRSTGEVCRFANIDLCRATGESEYYCTAFYVIINIKTMEMQYTNCGHPKALLHRAETNEIEELKTRGFMVGAAEFARYETKTTQLYMGDKFVVFSDGIIEAEDIDENMYSHERLMDLLLQNSKLNAADFAELVMKDLEDFVGEAPQGDDISLIVLDIIK